LLQRLGCKGTLKTSRVTIELRASDLEAEVKQLQEDLKSIRALLGLNLEENNAGKT
jgi:hypothetical protein